MAKTEERDVDEWDEIEQQLERAKKDPRIRKLVKAAEKGDLAAVKRLLDDGADPNAPAPNHDALETPLWAAIGGGKLEVIPLLAAAGADLNDGFPRTPLGAAAAGGRLDLARALIAGGADVNRADNSHHTPLMHAVLEDQPDAAAVLLEAGADPCLVAKRETYERVTNYSPLEYATMSRKKALVALLSAAAATKAGGDAKQGKQQAANLLCAAAFAGDLAEVKSRLEQGGGADVNCRDAQGRTPLINALMQRQKRVVKYLLNQGADVNLAAGKKGDGASPLIQAADSGDVDVVRLLVEAGGDLDYEIKAELGFDALAAAKACRRKKVVEYLLDVQKSRPGGQRGKSLAPPTGVTTFDTEDAAFLVAAPVDDVAGALKRRVGAGVWLRDALGKEAKLTKRCYAVFKLVGQPWTIVTKVVCNHFKHWPSLPDARAISAELRARALFVANSDAGGATQYALFENGELVELFEYASGSDGDAEKVIARYDSLYGIDVHSVGSLKTRGGMAFASRVRKLDLTKVKNDIAFIRENVTTQNAFVPFFVEGWGRAGKAVRLSHDELGADDVERLDYVAVE